MKTSYLIGILMLGTGFAHGQFAGSEDFAAAAKNTAKWGPNLQEHTGLLTQSGGTLHFSNTDLAGEGMMAWPWKVAGPYGSSWSVQADINMPLITLADGQPRSVGMGVGVRNAADSEDFMGVALENVRSTGQPQKFSFVCGIDVNGATTEVATPAAGTLGAVRIVWNAETHTLSALYDADGPVNGYQWTVLRNFDPTSAGWDMDETGTFEVILAGYSEHTTVALNKNVFADNFKASVIDPANLAGSDNFDDDSKDLAKWGADEGEGGSALAETNGRLEFTKAAVGDSWAGRPWIANSGSYTEDWEAFADVHLSDLAMPVDGDDLRMYLDVEAGSFSAGVQLELKNEGGSQVRQFRYEDEGPGGDSQTAPTVTTDGAVRVAFDSTEKVLNFYYDDDGGIDGYTWTPLGSLDVDDVASDWGLTDASRFRISIDGESEGVAVASGEAYADNFNAASAYVPVIVGSPAGFDDFAGIGKNTQKWGAEIHAGNGEFIQSGDGVLRFTGSGVGDEGSKARLWQANGTFSGSWSVQADVHVPVIPLAPGSTAAGMGIAVLNSADQTDNFAVSLENYRATGQPQLYHFFSSLDVNGESKPEIFVPTSSTLGAVRIAWNHTTKQLTAACDADGPLNGYQWTVFKTFTPAATVAAGGWGMTAASSFKIAILGSSEETTITLGHDFYADNFYVFGSLTTVLPVVKTTAADDLLYDGATLHGSVDGKGSERAVMFEWGTTTSYGSMMPATPPTGPVGIVDGLSNTLLFAEVTGLMPHTKYNYRVRASSALGSAVGANMTFTTKNRNPTPVADAFVVSPGAAATLDVLGHGTPDTDPDDDPLSVLSFTPLIPASAGKLTKSGNNLVFTASASFTAASFSYVVKDAFGGSASASVSLTKGTCTLDHAQVFPLPSAGVTYDVGVTATGAWSVVESLPWVAAVPISGTGDGTVQITLLPNAMLASRSGTVMIGGEAHVISQAGVLPPEISFAGDPSAAIVSGYYELQIETVNAPVVYTTTNLPPGLTMNQATGLISGTPSKAGNYDVTVKAKNAAGNAGGTPATVLAFTIHVAGLDAALVGNFHGLISPNPLLNAGIGSRLELTATNTGSVTGKIITGTTSQALTGRWDANVLDPLASLLTVNVPRTQGTPLVLNLGLDGVLTLFGNLSDPITLEETMAQAWRNSWTTTHKATAFKGTHSFSLEQDVPDSDQPQGFGYGSFNPNENTGALTVSGRLPDNSSFTTSTFIGECAIGIGHVLIYTPLYGNKGSVCGVLYVNDTDPQDLADNEISNSILIWSKPPSAPTAKDTVYPAGFTSILNVEGGGYVGIPPGGVVMELDNEDSNARLQFTLGQLDPMAENKEFSIIFNLRNPSLTGLTNKATFATDLVTNPNKVTMPVVTTATGAFSGEFTLPGATTALNRKVAYQGQIVRGLGGGFQGRGFCLVPEPIVPPLTATTTPKWSSRVVLDSAK